MTEGFTITYQWSAKWWQKPWYWIRLKPTRRIIAVYNDCKVTDMIISDDGSIETNFIGIRSEQGD